jgi:hypothetical protein
VTSLEQKRDLELHRLQTEIAGGLRVNGSYHGMSNSRETPFIFPLCWINAERAYLNNQESN